VGTLRSFHAAMVPTIVFRGSPPCRGLPTDAHSPVRLVTRVKPLLATRRAVPSITASGALPRRTEARTLHGGSGYPRGRPGTGRIWPGPGSLRFEGLAN
jgi:hypothetical protein